MTRHKSGATQSLLSALLATALLASLLTVASLATVGGIGAAPAQAAEDESRPYMTLSGHGWGHGRGMGQWGAQGYALAGQSSSWILDHFYGGTNSADVGSAASPIDPQINPAAVRVELRGQRSAALRTNLAIGTMNIVDVASGAVLGQATEGQTVHLQVLSSGGLQLRISTSCYDAEYSHVADYPDSVAIEVQAVSDDGGPDGLLRLCEPDGSSRWYEGALRANNVAGQTRTINVVSLESLIRGIVPNEVPASWEPAALQAQSVAARSYAMAGDTRQQPYADTCDTILCQVYGGRYHQEDGGLQLSTHERTDAAIAATAGIIRSRQDNGLIARTEFSASTGGHTKNGDFPAVADEGDVTPANPNHDWEKTVDLGGFEASAGKGQLLSVAVTERNGLGQDGGRVETLEFTFESGTVTMTGNEARRKFGLKSDWFTPGPVQRFFANTAAARYISEIHELFLDRPATSAEQAAWIQAVEDGRRQDLTDGLALSDEWAGVVVDNLYRSALGRPADAAGRSHWRGQIVAGVRVEVIGALFYGSPEYYQASGGNNETFVAALYRDLLGRQADSEGLAYWAGQLADGSASTSDVAAGFYASVESRRSRVSGLYASVLNRGPDSAGHTYWADQLLTTDDVRLASELAASQESFSIRTN